MMIGGREVHISVILPCRNEAASIEECIRSIFAQERLDGAIEVIVADGLSDDGTREIIGSLGDRRSETEGGGAKRQERSIENRIPLGDGRWKAEDGAPNSQITPMHLIDNPARIVPTGLNAAIRAAQGDIIVRMDAHTEYASDYVCRCVEALEQSGADNVGGPWVAKGIGALSCAIAAAFQSPFAVGGARGHDPHYEGPVDTVYLGCWRWEAFERFGYFDEELVRNQDDEHNLRIIRGGGRIYQSPKIRSWYRPRGSLTALFKQYTQYGYWKVRVIQKHKLPASWRHLVPGAFVLTLSLLFLLSTFCFLLGWDYRTTGLQDYRTTGLRDYGTTVLHPAVGGQWSVVSGLPEAGLVLLLGAYLVMVIAASLHTAFKTEWKLLPVLPAVFACYHFGYGYGFLRGVWDFVIRKRKARAPQFQALTR